MKLVGQYLAEAQKMAPEKMKTSIERGISVVGACRLLGMRMSRRRGANVSIKKSVQFATSARRLLHCQRVTPHFLARVRISPDPLYLTSAHQALMLARLQSI